MCALGPRLRWANSAGSSLLTRAPQGWVDQPLVSTTAGMLAVLLTRRGQAARAGVLWGYLTGCGMDMTQRNSAQHSAASIAAVLELPDAHAIVARGDTMSRDEIVAFARESLEAPDHGRPTIAVKTSACCLFAP